MPPFPDSSTVHSDVIVPWFQADRLFRVEDADGYFLHTDRGILLDLNSGYWTVGLGHRNSAIHAAVLDGYFADLFRAAHTPAEVLAGRLCQIFDYKAAVFACSGSSSVDISLRVAWQLTHAREAAGILSLKGGYHGSTALALAASGLKYDKFLHFDFPHKVFGKWCFDSSLTDDEALSNLEREGIDWPMFSSFIFEPIQGVAGARPVSASCLKVIARKCRENRVMVIADEITTGLGRIGWLTVSESLGVKPDLLCLGKLLTNGEFPLYVVLLSSQVVDGLAGATSKKHERYLFGETFGGHPAGCLAAQRVLEIVSKESFLSEVRRKGDHLGRFLESEFAGVSAVTDIRGQGMMWGISVVNAQFADSISRTLVGRGIRLVNEGRTLMLMPALTMPLEQIEEALAVVKSVIKETAPVS
jgi:adenosylmethionine-8-amino-7-oxononanoate aminotransferase